MKNRYSYDAWGRPRNPNTWQLLPSTNNAQANQSTLQPRFDRGYTGHEHMAGFGLINMNGRLYDPYLQRFLSPDNVVQAPGNSQSYNRYTYCLNNPLMYTDPSGYNVVQTYSWDNQDLSVGGMRGGSAGYSFYGSTSSGGNYFSRPGVGGNGTGLNGTYYDWSTGEYRDANTYEEVYGPVIYSGDIFSSCSGADAQTAYKGLMSARSGAYSVTLRDVQQNIFIDISSMSTINLGFNMTQDFSLPKQNSIYFPRSTGGNSFIDVAMNWVIDPLSNGATVGAGLKYTSSNILREGYWRGANGVLYPLSLTKEGGTYIRSANIAKNSVNFTGMVGQGLGYLSLAYSAYKFGADQSLSNGVDLGVSIVSVAFWEVGAAYYGINSIYNSSQFNYNQRISHGLNPFIEPIMP